MKNYYSFGKSKSIIRQLLSEGEESVKNLEGSYGSSKTCYDEIRRKMFPSNFFLLMKLLEWIVLISGFIYTYRTASYKIQPYLLTILFLALYFVYTGDARLIGTVKMNRSEFIEYCFVQIGMVVFSAFIQLFISVGVPMLIANFSYSAEQRMKIGPAVEKICFVFAAVSILFLVYGGFHYLVKAKIWMSCIVIQGVGLTVSLYYFWDYMFRCAVTGYENFWLGAYFISFIFSIIWVTAFLPKKKEEF